MRKLKWWLMATLACSASAQVITTNRNPVGMEHNLLFNAQSRFTVTQSGPAALNLPMLFDGNFQPSYTDVGIPSGSPTIVTIDGLPGYHTQAGTIVGWSTRYWPADHFKIEAYNIYAGADQWVVVADYSTTAYSGDDFRTWLRDGAYSKLRFTFYSAIGDGGRLGVSEIFFLHPEACAPYEGLIPKLYDMGGSIGVGTTNPGGKFQVTSADVGAVKTYSTANGFGLILDQYYSAASDVGACYTRTADIVASTGDISSSQIRFLTKPANANPTVSLLISGSGNIGIGTTAPTEKLSVKGKIRAQEVVVETMGWSDHVFSKGYKLASLPEIERHIEQQGRLPGVPSAQEVAEKGVSVGDMQAILLAKIEELTLHQIAQEKNQVAQEKRLSVQDERIKALEAENVSLKAQTK